MAKKLTFTGAYVRHAALALSGKDGAKTVRVDFTMGWTAKVRQATDWSDLQTDQDAVDLKGSMSVLSISLEAGSKTFDLGSGVLKNFNVVRVKDGKSEKYELCAQYVTNGHTVAAKVESYAESTSRAKGELRVDYDWVSEQEEDGEGKQGELVEE